MGITHAAVYDATVAVEGGFRPYAVAPQVPRGSSLDAAVAAAAHRVLGSGPVNFTLDSLVTGQTRSYRHFQDALREVNNVRVWAGFHFRGSDEEGATLGRQVAEFVRAHAFQPVS